MAWRSGAGLQSLEGKLAIADLVAAHRAEFAGLMEAEAVLTALAGLSI